MIGGKNIPNDEKLYSSIKKKVKAKFQKTSRWPSAYGSGFLVKEYKKAGGTYTNDKSNKMNTTNAINKSSIAYSDKSDDTY